LPFFGNSAESSDPVFPLTILDQSFPRVGLAQALPRYLPDALKVSPSIKSSTSSSVPPITVIEIA
jgi:hypothetical protein